MKQRGSHVLCYQTFSSTIPVSRRSSRAIVKHSPTTRLTFSLASSRMAGLPAITWDPIKTFFPNSLSWVRHMKIGLRSRLLRDFPRS